MDKKINVFFMGARGYQRNYGGWETFFKKIIDNWEASNFQFYAYELSEDKNQSDIVMLKKVICPQIYSPKIGGATMVYFSYKALIHALRFIKKNKIENSIIYVVGYRIGPVFFLLKKKLKKLGIKVIINPDGLEWKRSKWNKLVKLYFKFSEYTMYKSVDKIICDSKSIENYICDRFPFTKKRNLTTYISYGAESVKTSNSRSLEDFFKKNSIFKKQYFLIIGRFVPENNIELIIKEYMNAKTNKKLLIISNVDKGKFYKKLLKSTKFNKDKRIIFAGTVYDEKLLSNIRENAFAYIHGHSVGGTNPSLLEAMLYTNINILYDVQFNREVSGDCAFYFSDKLGSLTSAINQVENLQEREIDYLGDKCKQVIFKNYTWSDVVNKHSQLFNELIYKDERM